MLINLIPNIWSEITCSKLLLHLPGSVSEVLVGIDFVEALPGANANRPLLFYLTYLAYVAPNQYNENAFFY